MASALGGHQRADGDHAVDDARGVARRHEPFGGQPAAFTYHLARRTVVFREADQDDRRCGAASNRRQSPRPPSRSCWPAGGDRRGLRDRTEQPDAGTRAHATACTRARALASRDLAAAAVYLGLSPSQLAGRLSGGKTLAQVADATPGKSAAGLTRGARRDRAGPNSRTRRRTFPGASPRRSTVRAAPQAALGMRAGGASGHARFAHRRAVLQAGGAGLGRRGLSRRLRVAAARRAELGQDARAGGRRHPRQVRGRSHRRARRRQAREARGRSHRRQARAGASRPSAWPRWTSASPRSCSAHSQAIAARAQGALARCRGTVSEGQQVIRVASDRGPCLGPRSLRNPAGDRLWQSARDARGRDLRTPEDARGRLRRRVQRRAAGAAWRRR